MYEPTHRYQGKIELLSKYIEFSVYNVVDKSFSKDCRVIKLTKKKINSKTLYKQNYSFLKDLKNKKKFRKKMLEIVGAHLINSIWLNYRINKKEVRTLWK